MKKMENTEEEIVILASDSREDKLLTRLFFVVFFGSIFFGFLRFVVFKNYYIEAQSDCDPTVEKCFVWQCDPESTVEGEACTGDPESDASYYKIIKKKANTVPACDPNNDENCPQIICAPGEKNCTEIFCNEENKIDQEAECNDPEQYLKDNPPEEEDSVDDGDATEESDGLVDEVDSSDTSEASIQAVETATDPTAVENSSDN
jgi:hypothetical protein